MRVLILGAGVIGTTTAWYATQAGLEAIVVARREGPSLETSFANGGQVSAGHSEPWANPQAPAKIFKWLWRDDSPLLFRAKLDPAQWEWGARFLLECLESRTRRNIEQLTRLSLYSRDTLRRLRADTGIRYDEVTRGILHFFTDARDFERAVESAALMRSHGLERDAKSVDEAIAIEPALESARDRIVGATYTASDESGDAHLFTRNLAALAESRGASFRYNQAVLRLRLEGDRIAGVDVRSSEGEHVLKADAYVVAMGSFSPLLTRPAGIDLPVYPAKGYSATIEVADPAKAPTVSLTDEASKIVMSRLGRRLRVAGTAELAGYSTTLNPVRCEALVRRARELFPGACHYDRATFWTGLRPSTPSNVPLIGGTRYANLYLNTGHGTLGWTLACGSGQALADIISGRRPQVDFAFTSA
ncbi:MAG: D-amino acid dehydrogenase [Bacillota bacterium]